MRLLIRGGFVLGLSVAPFLQGHPDFSGTWVAIPERSTIIADDGTPVKVTVFGDQFVAQETNAFLTIAIDNEGGFTWVYRLDGAASRNVHPAHLDRPVTTQVSWNGDRLTIAYAENADGKPVQSKRTLRLNEDGTLRVEAPWGRDHAMISTVYKRQKDDPPSPTRPGPQ